MMTITHLLTGSLATGLFLQTPQPEILLTGAIASLLPDIDISTSPIGRVFIPVSSFLEKRLAHRSATHSIVASGLLGVISYGLYLRFPVVPLGFIHALNVGYFAGWFIDCFTKSGVEMFYPLPLRCVCPGNRNLRFSTGSPQEYWLIVLLVAIAIWVFQVNSHGGMMTEFNRMIAAPSGVEELYNQQGGTHQIIASVEGVYASDRTTVRGDFEIVAASDKGNSFIVLGDNESLYKAGTEPDANIITQRITGRVGKPATVQVETLSFLDEDIGKLARYQGKQAYLTGSLTVDDAESIQLTPHPREYQAIALSGNTLRLDTAPIAALVSTLSDQFVTGSLSIRDC
jgi:inner membrane protein